MLVLPLVGWRLRHERSSIEHRSGGVVEARILGGSPGSVYLADPNHERFSMRRDDIAAWTIRATC